MRLTRIWIALAFVIAGCGGGAGQSPQTRSPQTQSPQVETTTTAAPSTTTTGPTSTSISTTSAPPDAPGNFREEWIVTTNGGTIQVIAEHGDGITRWTESFGTGPNANSHVVVIAGELAWERFGQDEWTVADPATVGDGLFGHPFETADVLAEFTVVGTDIHEGREVTVYHGTRTAVVPYVGVDPDLIEDASAEVALYDPDTFARYEILLDQVEDRFATLTYRVFDEGIPIEIEPSTIEPDIESCRDQGNQLIDEVGSYRSRYSLLQTGAAFGHIEELRLLDPWAWQIDVTYRGAEEPFVETLWVDGTQYWREPGGEWQIDEDFVYQSSTFRPFVDDLWIPDVVSEFSPVRTDEVAGRQVDVYELGLEDVGVINDSLTRDTSTLSVTLWIEPCWSPQLMKMEAVATGRRYAKGEFHVEYEVYDLGTEDTIDLPQEAQNP